MNKLTIALTGSLILFTLSVYSQVSLKQYKAGHVFNINLPDYMSKTIGLNDAAAIQYKSVVKDVYGFVIFDTKEDLQLAEMNFASVKEFYENFITDFVADQENRKVSEPVYKTIGGVNFVECDLSYFDSAATIEIYYLVGIVETKTSFYKVLSWSAADKKDKFKTDFQQILYSLKD
jgi:hypothetical protein